LETDNFEFFKVSNMNNEYSIYCVWVNKMNFSV
jgi:hypothetical protein